MTVEDRVRGAARDIHRAVEIAEASTKTGEHGALERFERFRVREDRNRAIGTIALVLAVFVVIAFGAASVGNDSGHGKPADTGTLSVPSWTGTVTITNGGCTLDGEMTTGAGRYGLGVINNRTVPMTVQIFAIADDARFARMVAFVGRTTPLKGTHDWGRMWGFPEYAGTSETDVAAHDSIVVSGALDSGTYGIICFGPPSERYRPGDLIGPIDVRSG
jgi:hypothetical protein